MSEGLQGPGMTPPSGGLGSAVTNAGSPYLRGFRAALEGMKTALRSEEVGHAYLKLAAAIFGLSLAIDAGALMVIVLWVARVVGILVSVIVGPLLAVFIVNIAFPFFNQGVFLAGVRAVDPERAVILESKRGLSLPRGAGIATLRLLGFLALSLCCLLIGLIPVVGTIAGTAGQVWVTARALSWELIDPYLDALELGYSEQRAFVRAHRGVLIGFGLPVSLMMAIPFVGPLFFGLAQAAGGMFVARELPVDPRERVDA